MIAACIGVFVIVTIIQPRFADEGNLQVIGLDLANYGILTIGGGIVILTAGIDLSPGSIVALCSMVSAYLNVNDHVPAGLCVIISIAIGIVIGYLHGWFITRLDVPPFAITLVTLTAAAGAPAPIAGVVQNQVDKLGAFGFEAECSLQGDLEHLDERVRLLTAKVITEGASNISKYGDPRDKVQIMVDGGPAELEVVLVNTAIEPEPDHHNGLGLVGLHEVATAVGGTLRSGPVGSRWILQLCVPLQEV